MPKTATFETNKGTIVADLFEKEAPITVENFEKLANSGFYDGVKFHRVISDFVVQGGDPLSRDLAGRRSAHRNRRSGLENQVRDGQQPAQARRRRAVHGACGQEHRRQSVLHGPERATTRGTSTASTPCSARSRLGIDVMKKIAPNDVMNSVRVA